MAEDMAEDMTEEPKPRRVRPPNWGTGDTARSVCVDTKGGTAKTPAYNSANSKRAVTDIRKSAK